MCVCVGGGLQGMEGGWMHSGMLAEAEPQGDREGISGPQNWDSHLYVLWLPVVTPNPCLWSLCLSASLLHLCTLSLSLDSPPLRQGHSGSFFPCLSPQHLVIPERTLSGCYKLRLRAESKNVVYEFVSPLEESSLACLGHCMWPQN